MRAHGPGAALYLPRAISFRPVGAGSRTGRATSTSSKHQASSFPSPALPRHLQAAAPRSSSRYFSGGPSFSMEAGSRRCTGARRCAGWGQSSRIHISISFIRVSDDWSRGEWQGRRRVSHLIDFASFRVISRFAAFPRDVPCWRIRIHHVLPRSRAAGIERQQGCAQSGPPASGAAFQNEGALKDANEPGEGLRTLSIPAPNFLHPQPGFSGCRESRGAPIPVRLGCRHEARRDFPRGREASGR